MRQRVALIRTLAMNPDILLLDEPFSALDYQTRLSVSDDVYKIIKDTGKTTIMVTHDIGEAIKIINITKKEERLILHKILLLLFLENQCEHWNFFLQLLFFL